MKKKYVLVGSGGRSAMFIDALGGNYRENGELTALCDINRTRMEFYNNYWQEKYGLEPLTLYPAADFDRMIEEQKPDCVIVTTLDRAHHRYICRAMELGCDAITEKPMTVDEEKCQQIVDTVNRTGRDLRVAFNYRYIPRNTRIKEVLSQGIVGDIMSVHFEWLLDTKHGADYFRRWHRDKRNSGGLLVHKATHHFDLANWWLNDEPETVFSWGDLKFYGRENAEERGITQFYSRARGSDIAANDPFSLQVTEKDKRLLGLYYNAEHEDGYYRDQSVFGDGISIEDTMAVMVRYRRGCLMTYSLNAHCPWEGYRVMFNGTRGRLEVNAIEKSYVSGDHEDFNTFGMREIEQDRKTMVPQIIFQPHWGKATEVTYEMSTGGGHGGGDRRLLSDIFVGRGEDPLGHAAGYVDGCHSILVGVAGNRSMELRQPVKIRDLVKF